MSVHRAKRRPAHARSAPRPAVCAVITCSDTRGPGSDPGGDLLVGLLTRGGHSVRRRAWSHDRVPGIRAALRAALSDPDIDLVVLTGGTGLAARDLSPEAVRPLLERELPGFGERFRARSAERIGEAAWLSRALAGAAHGRLVVLLPGAPDAITLGIHTLLLPELGHALRLLGRFSP